MSNKSNIYVRHPLAGMVSLQEIEDNIHGYESISTTRALIDKIVEQQKLIERYGQRVLELAADEVRFAREDDFPVISQRSITDIELPPL